MENSETNSHLTREDRTNELELLCEEILSEVRHELFLSMRYLYPALEKLQGQPDKRINGMGTDGRVLLYQPMLTVQLYREDAVKVNRRYLHCVLHGLFAHCYRRGSREEELWNLSTNIAVEILIDDLPVSAVRKVVMPEREVFYEWLLSRTKVLSAERIYEVLRAEYQDRIPARLVEVFSVDDHSFWEKDSENPEKERKQQEQNEKEREMWREIRERTQTAFETYARTIGGEHTRLYQELVLENTEKTDYREFIRKFAVLQEKMQVDPDSFDYGYYQYGMQRYGNMPLIEELEYREDKQIQEFAIIVDTSGSCSKELVSAFLQETLHILSEAVGEVNEKEHIGVVGWRRVCCHILQCDNQIQTEQTVSSLTELEAYLADLQITGRGGTDFRPAFSYVQEKKNTGEWKSLKGLFYFTDGYGIYPKTRPDFETVFVFPEEAFGAGADRSDALLPWKSKEFPAWGMHISFATAYHKENRRT